jgi:hypothetical protein
MKQNWNISGTKIDTLIIFRLIVEGIGGITEAYESGLAERLQYRWLTNFTSKKGWMDQAINRHQKRD